MYMVLAFLLFPIYPCPVYTTVQSTTQPGFSLPTEYPDPPTNVAVTETAKSLLVSWEHTPSLPDGNAATSFAVYLNGERCCQVATSLSPSSPTQCVEIMSKDIRKLDEEWTTDSSVQLTVRALADLHESRDSLSLLLTKRQVSLLLTQRSRMVVSEESSSSEVSMTSSEEDKKHYSPAKAESDQHQVTDNGDHVTGHDDHMTDHVTNGVIEEENEEQQGNLSINLIVTHHTVSRHLYSQLWPVRVVALKKQGNIVVLHVSH